MERYTLTFEFVCTAPKSVFVPDCNNIPKKYQDIIEKNGGGIGCERNGEAGPWCILHSGCPFADWDDGWDCGLL